MSFKNALLNTVTAVTGICAVALTVQSFLGGGQRTAVVGAQPSPLDSAAWQPLLASGHRIGPPDARLTVIEFADYQCPVCEGYERVLDSMRAKYPKDFAIVFHDFPLSYHPLAMPLAIAARCADAQGGYLAFHDSVFAGHDELGVISIEDFARRAGVSDIPGFNKCMRDPTVKQEVNADIALGTSLRLSGTPSVIANGVLHTSDLHVADLEKLLAASQ